MNLRMRCECYLVGVINRDIGGIPADFIRVVLRFLSCVYAVLVSLRVYLYRHRILRPDSLGCFTISVGNITAGGTGKTPVVEMIAKQFIQGGRRPAILSRGYKRCARRGGAVRYPRIVSDGSNISADADAAGDEPYMLAKEIPGAVVLVDKNRIRAGRYAVKRLGADVVILDDGYQYLPVSRNVNIVLIDCTNPFSGGRLIPGGMLREPVNHLNRADVFLLTKTKGMDLYGLKKRLKSIKPSADIIETTHTPRYLNDVYSGTKKGLGWLAARRIACVSGIASPGGFEKLLSELGAAVVNCYRFEDHHRYTAEEAENIIKTSKSLGLDAVITTQKDAVRFPKLRLRRDLPLYYLRVEIDILSGAKDFYDKIEKICF